MQLHNDTYAQHCSQMKNSRNSIIFRFEMFYLTSCRKFKNIYKNIHFFIKSTFCLILFVISQRNSQRVAFVCSERRRPS